MKKNKRNIHENITKSKNLIKWLIFILVILGIIVGSIIIFHTHRLYVNINKAEEEKMVASINNYFNEICNKENPSTEAKCYTANKIYLVERIIDSDNSLDKQYKNYDNYYYAYSWVLNFVYVNKEQDSSSSIPNKILLGKKGDTYTALKNEIPRDGTYYPEDMQKLFPAKIRTKINNASIDGTVTELKKEIDEQLEK